MQSSQFRTFIGGNLVDPFAQKDKPSDIPESAWENTHGLVMFFSGFYQGDLGPPPVQPRPGGGHL
jgi:hypothetical protein